MVKFNRIAAIHGGKPVTMKGKKPIINIGIVSPVDSEAERIFVDNLVRVIAAIANEVVLLTENFSYRFDKRVHVIEVNNKSSNGKRSLPSRFYKRLAQQLKLTFNLIKVSKHCDIIFFHTGEFWNVLPLLFAKLLRKKVVISHLGGNKTYEISLTETSRWCKIMVRLATAGLIRFCYSLANSIACQSENIISFGKLDRYRCKIIITGGCYIDTRHLGIEREQDERQDVIGFVGNFRPVKGVTNFAKSTALVARDCENANFILVGGGPQEEEVRNEIRKAGTHERVTFAGWVSHDEIPRYLNQMKLLVLASYTEGMPGVVIEAMSCGAVVLATPVGGVPDVIKNGETGFIMEDNSPECIARNVIRVLNHPDLGQITRNARALVEKEYTYEMAVERYRKILENI